MLRFGSAFRRWLWDLEVHLQPLKSAYLDAPQLYYRAQELTDKTRYSGKLGDVDPTPAPEGASVHGSCGIAEAMP